MSTNQHNEGVKLCASYWTLAGDVFPGGPSEISPFPIEDRIVAAGAAGWQAMGFILPDIVESIRRLGINEIRNLLYTNRIVAVELELLENWYLADGRRSADQAALETMLAIADSLPVAKIKIATGARGEALPPRSTMRDALGYLSERAAVQGVDIVLEYMPFKSVGSIETAVELVRDLPSGNVGILLDTWHTVRGGMTPASIESIPTGLLKAVELNDAAPLPEADLFEESTHSRRLCGEGSIDLPAYVQAILDAGYGGYWGVEILSREFRKLPLHLAAQKAFASASAQFSRAGAQADSR
ncbi:MAG: sugar phosphate isomerase/epimerase [Acidobacteriaceae bacterium]|nr:sugar phosphate isomerase/epimerase [Acidobacteriaceae bacterium]